MIREYLAARQYLAPPPDAFWRWSEEGRVLTWTHGSTLAFREELVSILRRLESVGLPSFAELALVLAACRDNWPATAGSVLKSHRLFRQHGLVPPHLIEDVLHGLDHIRALPAELRGDLSARAELAAIASEEADEIAAVAEEIHDVVEVGRVTEANGVPQFMQARQVHDRIAHQRIGARGTRHVGTERGYIGPDEHRRAAPPIQRQRTHLAVLTRRRRHEVNAQQRLALARGWLKLQRSTDRAFPHLECPAREIVIAGPGL